MYTQLSCMNESIYVNKKNGIQTAHDIYQSFFGLFSAVLTVSKSNHHIGGKSAALVTHSHFGLHHLAGSINNKTTNILSLFNIVWLKWGEIWKIWSCFSRQTPFELCQSLKRSFNFIFFVGNLKKKQLFNRHIASSHNHSDILTQSTNSWKYQWHWPKVRTLALIWNLIHSILSLSDFKMLPVYAWGDASLHCYIVISIGVIISISLVFFVRRAICIIYSLNKLTVI